MSSSINLKYEKASFLSKSNSAFIEEMYLRFIKKDPNLPDSWKIYFKTNLIIYHFNGNYQFFSKLYN